MTSRRWFRASSTPTVVLLGCLALTTVMTAYVWYAALQRDQARFDSAVRDLSGSLAARMDTYVALLRAGSAFFAVRGGVDREEFRHYVEHLDLRARFAGIQGIAYAARTPAPDLARLEAEIRQSGFAEFAVRPAVPKRPVYYPIVLIEPLDPRNRAALGFDMYSDETRRAAMRAAMLSGQPVASGKVRLVQEIDPANEQAGFLVYLPVYRDGGAPETEREREQDLLGFLYSPFRTGDLFGAVLTSEDRRLLAVRVYDGDPAEPNLLFDSARGQSPGGPPLEATVRVEVSRRAWTLVIRAREPFGGTAPQLVPGIFLLGVGVSVALFLLTRAEARARNTAEATAEALRGSEEALQAAGRAKDEFLATLSHELRTPLNAVLGWTRLLRMGHLDESRRAAALEVVERNARAQAQLIEDLLDVSRIITGKLRLDLRTVAVNPVIEEAVNTVRPAADAKAVTLEWHPNAAAGSIYAAPDRLQQIAWNLLSNAIKFTPSGGRVEISTERAHDALCITVRDTGVGIAPEFLPHVFERFRQADSTTTRTHSGVGLGLAIVRHLVELHGGTIHAASDGKGRGATFSVRFPVRRVPAGVPAAAGHAEQCPRAATGGSLDGLRVLVVDDEPDARTLVASALAAHGADVKAVGSVADALPLLELDAIDVVVTDVAMPGEDGFSLVERLRGSGSRHLRMLPVIALTAYARTEDRERVLSRGFQAFIAKPLEVEELTATVADVTGRSAPPAG